MKEEILKHLYDIKDAVNPAYQLRRYGWSAKLPLSILTDFEEFAVYDCRVKPAKMDKVSHSRIIYLKYTDYIDQWNEIANIFSREAILKGSFDKYIESKKTKKGTAEVDKAFLAEIERWRELLARNIALRNPNLTQREINFSVQQTIDRIVFLRICEDRGIENYGRSLSGRFLYPGHQFAFGISLTRLDRRIARLRLQAIVNVFKRVPAINIRFPRSEQVEVRAPEDIYRLHHGVLSCAVTPGKARPADARSCSE